MAFRRMLSGIVTYNPDINRLIENINAIAPQVTTVLIVDNGSNNYKEIDSLLNNHVNVSIIYLHENKGIAYALNRILSYAESHNYEWFLTLDQDSVVPDNLIEEYSKATSIDKVALITCNIVDRNFEDKVPSVAYDYVSTCITSACLTNTRIARYVGGFDDTLFIDSVDHDLCIRIIRSGYKIYRMNNVNLLHELGHSHKISFWGFNYVVYNHSKFRYYYIFRNRIILGRKYGTMKSSIKYILLRFFSILFFEKESYAKIKSAIRGTVDGLNFKLL